MKSLSAMMALSLIGLSEANSECYRMNNKFECFNEVVSDVNENDLNLYASATDVYYNNGQY